MPLMTIAQASEATGKSRSTLIRAIKAEKLSAQTDANGHYCVHPAELFRVYSPVQNEPVEASVNAHEHNHDVTMLKAELALLRQQIENDQTMIRELFRRLDDEAAERRALVRLLTDQRDQGGVKSIFKRWW